MLYVAQIKSMEYPEGWEAASMESIQIRASTKCSRGVFTYRTDIEGEKGKTIKPEN